MARKKKGVTLLDILYMLHADARRVAAERKSFVRKPRAGGYGGGRRMQPDGSGVDSCRLALRGEMFLNTR